MLKLIYIGASAIRKTNGCYIPNPRSRVGKGFGGKERVIGGDGMENREGEGKERKEICNITFLTRIRPCSCLTLSG